MVKTLWISFILLILTACASNPSQNGGIANYEEIIEKNTQGAKTYEGLYNVMEFSATLQTPEVSQAIAKKTAQVYQWSESTVASEQLKMDQTLSSETSVMLSFFTPEPKHDNLSRNKSLWKVFLDVNGKRYEGKVIKIKQVTTEIQNLYPHHTRWSTPYKIVFPVPMNSIMNQEAKFTLTGPIGSESVTFHTTQ